MSGLQRFETGLDIAAYADNADDDVHQDAGSTAFDDLAGDPAGESANDDVADPAHTGQRC